MQCYNQFSSNSDSHVLLKSTNLASFVSSYAVYVGNVYTVTSVEYCELYSDYYIQLIQTFLNSYSLQPQLVQYCEYVNKKWVYTLAT